METIFSLHTCIPFYIKFSCWNTGIQSKVLTLGVGWGYRKKKVSLKWCAYLEDPRKMTLFILQCEGTKRMGHGG